MNRDRDGAHCGVFTAADLPSPGARDRLAEAAASRPAPTLLRGLAPATGRGAEGTGWLAQDSTVAFPHLPDLKVFALVVLVGVSGEEAQKRGRAGEDQNACFGDQSHGQLGSCARVSKLCISH